MGRREFTSLMGEEKKNFSTTHLHVLQKGMHYIQTKQNTVVEICQNFLELYAVINFEYSIVDAVESASIFILANEWVKLFITLEGERKRYETKTVAEVREK